MNQTKRTCSTRLRAYVEWAGRYPLPKDTKGRRPGQILPDTMMHPDTDRDLVERVFEKTLANYDRKFRRLA